MHERPKSERPARPHGDFPERHLAHACQHVARVVGVAHAHAATGQHHIGLCHGRLQGGLQRGGVVAHQTEVDDLDAQALQGADQAEAVAVVDAAGVQALPQVAQLVARREQRHTQAPHHLNFSDAQRCDEPHVGRPQHAARSQRRLALGQVFATTAAVLAGLDDARVDVHTRSVNAAQLLRHHGVGARRHHRAGHDAHALHAAQCAVERRAGVDRGDHIEHAASARREQRAVESEAVHRRVVVCRHVDGRDDIARQHAAQRLRERHAFALRDRLDGGMDGRARLGHAELRFAC